MGDTAKIFYIIYLILTILEFIVLMIAGMNPYDAAIHAMARQALADSAITPRASGRLQAR